MPAALFIILFCVVLWIVAFLALKYRERGATNAKKNFKANSDEEILQILLGLDDARMAVLFDLYRKEFGPGPARYARKTYQKWKNGKVTPVRQTFERFMVHLPKVMSFELKCEILRRLMAEYAPKDHHELKISASEWEPTVIPLVNQLIDKAYSRHLPAPVERKLRWLGDGDMVAAREILARSRVDEGRIAASSLKDEFENIRVLLIDDNLRAKVEHRINLPGGTILISFLRD